MSISKIDVPPSQITFFHKSLKMGQPGAMAGLSFTARQLSVMVERLLIEVYKYINIYIQVIYYYQNISGGHKLLQGLAKATVIKGGPIPFLSQKDHQGLSKLHWGFVPSLSRW